MNYKLQPLAESDKAAVICIFNYFVKQSFAAFPDEPVGDDFFDRIPCGGWEPTTDDW